MFLLFDLSDVNIINLILFDKKEFIQERYEGQNSELLFYINNFLQKKGMSNKDVQGVCVVVKSGSFTSTRIATTVANTFAYVLNIPVLAIAKDDTDNMQALISKLLKQKRGQYISAKYSAEPNIAKSKK